MTELGTPRLVLEPLRVEHAAEMWPLLDDTALHTFTGGRPATLAELEQRYARQVDGHFPDRRARWLNWIVRRRSDRAAVGWVQATVAGDPQPTAVLAWTIATRFQRLGYAKEAAAEIARWLRAQGAVILEAHIHPEHEASIAVARVLGLHPTEELIHGEIRWVAER